MIRQRRSVEGLLLQNINFVWIHIYIGVIAAYISTAACDMWLIIDDNACLLIPLLC